MISILAQERLIGAALGSIFTAAVVFQQRRTIHSSIPNFPLKLRQKEPVLQKRSHLDFAHLWNRAVDQTLGPAIESLSSRGW